MSKKRKTTSFEELRHTDARSSSSISDLPKTIEAVRALTPFKMRLCLWRIGQFNTQEQIEAFHIQKSVEDKAQMVLRLLLEHDRQKAVAERSTRRAQKVLMFERMARLLLEIDSAELTVNRALVELENAKNELRKAQQEALTELSSETT